MKKLIAVLSVALVLVFSCVLTSFADDSVINGYAVEDVPYNESFEGVLTASDNGSQLYSSTNDKTYNTPFVLAAPATSSSALYYYKSVTNFIPSNIWRGVNSPTVSFPVSNGYTGVKYVWAESKDSNSVWHYNECPQLVNLKPGRKYRFTFDLKILTRVKGQFTFGLSLSSDFNNYVLKFVDKNAPTGGGDMLYSASRSYSLDLTLPESVSGILMPHVTAKVFGNQFEFYINDFTVTDITTEDLDNSLGKLGDKIDSSINPSVPYEQWDNGDLNSEKDKLNNAMGELPTVDFDAIRELKDSIDISSYSQAFASINQLFIRVVDTVGITPLIFFACFFGLCIFLIGRKLSGG